MLFISCPLANLHIANLLAIDYKSKSSTHLVKAIATCGTWIYVEQVIMLVKYDFEDVRVPGNKNIGAALFNHALGSRGVVVGITAYVSHQHSLALTLKKRELVV